MRRILVSFLVIGAIVAYNSCHPKIDIPNPDLHPVACFTISSTVTPTDIHVGDSITFDATCSKFATSWSWDFGDGNTSTLPGVTHAYAASGNYTVRLTVSIAGESPDTKTKAIDVL
jgi:PKD repeat protein